MAPNADIAEKDHLWIGGVCHNIVDTFCTTTSSTHCITSDHKGGYTMVKKK